jgi:hypothetical protein
MVKNSKLKNKEGEMYRKLTLLFFVFVLGLVLTSCDIYDPTPAPDVEIIYFDPIGVVVSTTTQSVTISQIDFKVWNYVEARVTRIEYRFLAVSDNSEVGSGLDIGLGILLAGGDEWCEESCITTVAGTEIDVTDAVTYMFANNDNTVAEITFSGVDAYSGENEWSCMMHYSLHMIPNP